MTSLRSRSLAIRSLAALAIAVLLAFAALGMWTALRYLQRERPSPLPQLAAVLQPPAAVDPGPGRISPESRRILHAQNARRMHGIDAREQRWCDVGNNFYASHFADRFSYAGAGGRNAPEVWVYVDPKADTFRGRLEARGLKPNFAYQMKLSGLFTDFAAYERIGYAGRWMMPGLGTNYSDEDYRAWPDPSEVQAYLLFDFFVTDENGSAIRPFSLDSSLHVLWSSRQKLCPEPDAVVEFVLDASDPRIYLRPKQLLTLEGIWAETEWIRYQEDHQRRRFLAPGRYMAELHLTEETFHSPFYDGGFWPTVMTLPVRFTVTAP